MSFKIYNVKIDKIYNVKIDKTKEGKIYKTKGQNLQNQLGEVKEEVIKNRCQPTQIDTRNDPLTAPEPVPTPLCNLPIFQILTCAFHRQLFALSDCTQAGACSGELYPTPGSVQRDWRFKKDIRRKRRRRLRPGLCWYEEFEETMEFS